jgi:hypothetical protein
MGALAPDRVSHTRSSRQRPVLWFKIGLAPPGPTWLKDRAWLLDSVQGAQRVVNRAALLRAVKRLAQRVAEGPFQVDHPRRAHLFGDLFQTDDADGRNPGGLDCAGDQSHGLVADSSGRCQQHRVDLFLLEHASDLRCCDAQQCFGVRRLDMTHEAVASGERADVSATREVADQLEREQDVQVALGVGWS